MEKFFKYDSDPIDNYADNPEQMNARIVRGQSVASDWADATTECNFPENRYNFKIGIYGWRKRCLYIIILSLMVIVIINIALTLWILKVMEFSGDGMGQLMIVPGGLQLNGQTMVLDSLIASSIRSRKGQHLTIDSSRNFTVQTRDKKGKMLNKIFMGNNRLETLAREFVVMDPQGNLLFSANRHEVLVGATILKVTGPAGAVFQGSLQTPHVRADSGNDLSLESPTRTLEIRAPQGIVIESRAGDIIASCLADIKLQSVGGSIHLDTANVFFPALKTASRIKSQESNSSNSQPRKNPQEFTDPRNEIYQLCSCSNGKLFLSPSDVTCMQTDNSNICSK